MKTIGSYLLDQLYKQGIREIYGIPGDFALSFFECLEKYKKIKLITLSHEPSLGFAADATARMTGRLSACAVTYGAGGFNILNPIACAYAEKSPVIVISGAPGMKERESGILFHHQAKALNSQLKVMEQVTQAQVILDDPKTAAERIHFALETAKNYSRPVYIEIPRDRVFEPIRISSKKNHPALLTDLHAVKEAANEIERRFRKSKHPVLMIGVEVHRFGLQKLAVKLAEKYRIPVVSSFMARSTFPVHHPQFEGIYMGPAGSRKVQREVEKSDCLILLGVPLSDTDMAIRLIELKPDHVVHAVSREVKIGYHHYQNVELKSLMEKLLKCKTPSSNGGATRRIAPTKALLPKPLSYFKNQKLIPEDILYAVQFIFDEKGEMPVTVDNGDCLFVSTLLNAENLLASGYYATMGFAVPAGIGVQISTKKRPIILVGDGAFQMTGPEISHCNRYRLNPIVIVFNNFSWGMLKVIQPKGKYFDLAPWPYAELAEDWGGKGYTVSTRQELFSCLLDAYQQKIFTIINAHLPPDRFSKVLKNYLAKVRAKK